MPVQETADGIEDLQHAKLPVGAVLVNLLRSNQLDDAARAEALADRLPREDISNDLTSVGLDPEPELLDGLLNEAHEHAQRRALEDEQRRHIDKLDVPVLDLPRLPDGIDLGGLYELAAELCEQGVR
jgi:hypothetical protein